VGAHLTGNNLSFMNYPNGSVNWFGLIRPPDDSRGMSLKSHSIWEPGGAGALGGVSPDGGFSDPILSYDILTSKVD